MSKYALEFHLAVGIGDSYGHLPHMEKSWTFVGRCSASHEVILRPWFIWLGSWAGRLLLKPSSQCCSIPDWTSYVCPAATFVVCCLEHEVLSCGCSGKWCKLHSLKCLHQPMVRASLPWLFELRPLPCIVWTLSPVDQHHSSSSPRCPTPHMASYHPYMPWTSSGSLSWLNPPNDLQCGTQCPNCHTLFNDEQTYFGSNWLLI